MTIKEKIQRATKGNTVYLNDDTYYHLNGNGIEITKWYTDSDSIRRYVVIKISKKHLMELGKLFWRKELNLPAN